VAAIAADTNIVVRLLVADDEPQAARARRLFEANEVWIGVTVLLEAAWVLTSVYELTAKETAAALRSLLGLPNVRVESPGIVAAALDASATGLEFADALHLLRAPDGAEFATFDRGLANGGRKLRPVRLL
jgi:predicted nucleic acid-binding protein